MSHLNEGSQRLGYPARKWVSPTLILVAAGALIFMTFMRYSIAGFGWIVFAPLLAFLHERGTIGRHLAVLATLIFAFLVAVSKMNTVEIPGAVVPFFAVPLAFSYFVALAFGSLAHRRLGVR